MKNVIQLEEKLSEYDTEKQAIAEHCLGYCYENGLAGAQKDEAKAFRCYEKAFELNSNHPDYARSLASCYRRGVGVEKNLEQAKHFQEIEDTLLFGAPRRSRVM